MADKAQVFADCAIKGRNLRRGEWASFTALIHNAMRYEIEFREYLNGFGESLQTNWGDPDSAGKITVYYRIGKKRGPKREP